MKIYGPASTQQTHSKLIAEQTIFPCVERNHKCTFASVQLRSDRITGLNVNGSITLNVCITRSLVTRKIFMDRVSKLFDYMVNDKLLHKNVILHDCRDGGPIMGHPAELLCFYYAVV